MQPSTAAMHSSTESNTAFPSPCRESFEKKPSMAFTREAEVGVKWNLQSGQAFGHS